MVKQVWGDFKLFLSEYKVITLAVAFVMGAATNELVKSLVTNILMPVVNPLIPTGSWETAVWTIGAVTIGWGPFLSSLLNFVILAWIIFVVVKKVLKHNKK